LLLQNTLLSFGKIYGLRNFFIRPLVEQGDLGESFFFFTNEKFNDLLDFAPDGRTNGSFLWRSLREPLGLLNNLRCTGTTASLRSSFRLNP
jgi:hypothetical protein